MLARLEVAQTQRSDPHPLQTLSCAAHGSKHASHLTLASFDQHDPHQAASGASVHQVYAYGPRRAVVQNDAVAQKLELLSAELGPRQLDVVLLFDSEPTVDSA